MRGIRLNRGLEGFRSQICLIETMGVTDKTIHSMCGGPIQHINIVKREHAVGTSHTLHSLVEPREREITRIAGFRPCERCVQSYVPFVQRYIQRTRRVNLECMARC